MCVVCGLGPEWHEPSRQCRYELNGMPLEVGGTE